MEFERLVRFEANGTTHYGNLVSESDGAYTVQPLHGSVKSGFSPTGQNAVVTSKVGSEHQFTAPFIFTKPADALHGPSEPVKVHPSAQSMLDYEGELVFVTSRDAKNLPEDFDLADYILGYTAGNDVSARNFQVPDASGGQYCYAKSFDQFAPIGPWLVSPALIPDPQKLEFVVRVNGEVRQKTGTNDMIWTVKQILRHLTQGTTLRAGTVVMTGTPNGVGYFSQRFLQDGDLVEVDVEGVAKLVHTVVYDLNHGVVVNIKSREEWVHKEHVCSQKYLAQLTVRYLERLTSL
ncbi:hypothetical protein ATERTT37_003205 [Aspergillus terreus]